MTDQAHAQATPVALVTGGSRRIGRALCHHLHAQGYNIALHYNRSQAPADELANQLNDIRPDSVRRFQADLNNHEAVLQLAEHSRSTWARMDVLINNASTFYPTAIGTADEQHWDELFASNCKAPFFLAQALAEDLKKAKGAIINILDIHVERPMPHHTIYCMAKAACRMLTQSLALELAPHVRVNGVAPGAALWPEDSDGNEKVATEKLQNIPLQQLGGANAIAEAACFLLKQNNYITGQILNVDGGKTLIQI